MAVAITAINNPRGRSGDSVSITGSGFNATMGNNTVTFNGVAASITGIVGTTQLTVTVPGSLGTTDYQVPVVVTNTGDATSATRYWFVLKNEVDYLAHQIQPQQPGPSENVAAETDTIPEAKDYERLAGYLDALRRDPGVAAIPNQSAGLDRIGTNRLAFPRLLPRSNDTAQAVIEAIYSRLFEPTRTVMSGNMTLAAGSARVQMFDCDNAARTIIAPDEVTGPADFLLGNIGQLGSATVTHDGYTLGTIAPRTFALLVTDGANGWTLSEVFAFQANTFTNGRLIPFVSGTVTVGNYVVHGANFSAVDDSTLDRDTEAVMTAAGSVLWLEGWVNTTGSVTFKTWKNGGLLDTVTSTLVSVDSENQFSAKVPSPGSFAAGDRLALEYDAGTGSPDMAIGVFFVPTANADARVYIGPWGVSSLTATQFAGHHGATTSDSTRSNVEEYHYPIPWATTIRRLIWNTQTGDSTTKVDIYKNGAALESNITLTGASGYLTPTANALALGDAIAIRGSSPLGTAPGASVFAVEVDGLGQYYTWAGQNTTSSGVFGHYRGRNWAGGDTPGADDYNKRAGVVASGLASGVAWYRNSTNNTTLQLYKNGALDQTITLSTSQRSGHALTATAYTRGDYMMIRDPDTTSPGAYIVAVYLAPHA